MTTRSANAGSDRGETKVVPSNTISSYTSSQTIHRSCATANCPKAARSAARSTAPVGLCGVFTNNTRLRGVMRAATSAACMRKPASARKGTGTITAPVDRISPS